jgi:unsaturated chondroitin disaccharide hydrolase
VSNAVWSDAIQRILQRIDDTAQRVGPAYPHWGNAETGEWITTPDGDWTGGYWVGLNWLAAKATGEERYRARASTLMQGLKKRIESHTVFKSFPIYYGASLGSILWNDASAREIALHCARSLVPMYDARLKLIPLGSQAEEGAHIGDSETSIDSLQAAPFLFWASRTAGDAAMRELALNHAKTIIPMHLRKDDSFIQSTSLDGNTGKVIRHYTHKGFSADSTWGRAQAWGMLFSTMSFLAAPAERAWLDAAQRGAQWWLEHLPEDRVAFWDFDDPAIPNTERDTAATAIACLALLKLAHATPDKSASARYRAAAEATAHALVSRYLTPTSPGDRRVPGILTESCFNKRADARPHDAANQCEFILAEYYLFESLLILAGRLEPATL